MSRVTMKKAQAGISLKLPDRFKEKSVNIFDANDEFESLLLLESETWPMKSHCDPGGLCLVSSLKTQDEKNFAAEADAALRMDIAPVQVDDESAGNVYFLKSTSGHFCAVFKPADEEPGTPRKTGDKMKMVRTGVPVGEGYVREAAAYLLDHDGFAGVPPTAIVQVCSSKWSDSVFSWTTLESSFESTNRLSRSTSCYEDSIDRVPFEGPVKVGSMQAYVSHHSCAEDVGPSLFTVDMVHRIGILDVRLLNTDRHGGNILIQTVMEGSNSLHLSKKMGQRRTMSYCESSQREDFRSSLRLVPIDHGLCLPRIDRLGTNSFDSDDDVVTLEWMNWPQAKKPFSHEIIHYVKCLDTDAEVNMLQNELSGMLSEDEFMTLRVCTTLLKHMVSNGYCLFEIGTVIMTPKLKSMVDSVLLPSRESLSSKNELIAYFNRFQIILEAEFPRKEIHIL